MHEENSHSKQYTAADIERYRSGKMTTPEMHAMEKAALEDPFLADAMEGFSHTEPASISGNIQSLKKRLDERINSGKIKPLPVRKSNEFMWMKIAAVLVLLIGLGWTVYRFTFSSGEQKVAVLENKMSSQAPAPIKDSTEDASTAFDNTATKEEELPMPQKAKTETADADFLSKSSSGVPGGQASNEKTLVNTEISSPVSLQAKTAGRELNANGYFKKADSSNTVGASANEAIRIRGNSTIQADSALLYVVNGTVTSKEVVEKINPGSIQNTEILKDSKASAIYGARAANGVLVITLKNSQEDIVKLDRNKMEMQRDKASENKSSELNNTTMLSKNAPGPQNFFRGQVSDANNNPLPFANVTNTNDNIGTYTDIKGNFTLISPDSILNVQVKSIGFTNGNTQLKNNTVKNQVVLQEEKDGLSEVVIGRGRKQTPKTRRDPKMILEEPEPADGWYNYDTYVANNLNPPDDIKQNKPAGRVEVSFDINDKGEPINIKVEKSLCKKCDEEAIRLIKEGPKWKKGKKGRGKMVIPF